MTYSEDSIVFLPTPTIHNFKDLTGQTFHRLTVLGLIGRNNQGVLTWLCRCECGNTSRVRGSNLRGGAVKSCGCLLLDVMRTMKTTHGMRRTATYRIWTGMMGRCNNPHVERYPHYGGRGIIVCERWHIFENFYADMGERPTSKHSLNRINNDGDYCPQNCEWATQDIQVNNRSTNRRIVIDGIERNLFQHLRAFGIAPSTFYNRIKRGWAEIDAITRPLQVIRK